MTSTIQLDTYQQAAVDCMDPRVSVIASPGSGKSKMLVSKYTHLVHDLLIPPSRIVVLTFSRQAAKELRERIGEDASGAYVGTIHSFCLNLLQMYGSTRQWEMEWATILDAEEVRLDLEEILNDNGIRRKGKWTLVTKKDWDKFVLRTVCGERRRDENPQLILAWDAFEDRLRAENVLTYDMLESEALELITGPHGDEIRERYRIGLIDEVQDCSSMDWAVLRALAFEHMTVVGDPRQTLYEWRGGRPELFREFSADATAMQLPYSYRFDVHIAAPANALMGHADDGLEMAIDAIGTNQGSVHVLRDLPFEGVPDIITKELLNGTLPGDIAILARKHSTLDMVEPVLDDSGIPFVRIGGNNSIDKMPEFRVVRGYMRLAVNPLDRRAFMAITPAEHLPEDEILTIKRHAIMDDVSMVEAYGKSLPADLEQIHAKVTTSLPDGDWDPVFEYLAAVCEREAITKLPELVQHLAMGAETDQFASDVTRAAVTLSTVHSSKGREWPVVVVLGLNAKSLPSPMAVRDGFLASERCCCFVALTRAEDRLYVINTVPTTKDDGPSPFLKEMNL